MLDQPSKSIHPEECVRNRYSIARDAISKDDKDTAILLLEENIARGCSDSMVLLGTILVDGSESEKMRGISLFEEASKHNNSSGYRNLAYCYAIGMVVPKDKEEAVELYLRASELGNARAACNLGVMYDYGNGTDKNFDEAFRWYTASAEGGCTRGMTNLGEYYLWGKGTPVNYAEAAKWFEKSGSPRATYRLAEIYLDTELKDIEKGTECLLKSAESGYSRAMARYAKLLEDSDPTKALEYYNKAAEKGNKDAIEYLESHGLPVPESMFSKRKKRKTQ